MSDFLSNFNGDNYDRRKEEKEPREPDKKITHEPKQPAFSAEESLESQTKRKMRSQQEATEQELSYQKQKKRKRRMILFAVVAACVLVGIVYYQQTHVKVPNFVGKNLTDVQVWASENKVKPKIKQTYDRRKDANTILAQEQKAGSRVKKGGVLNVTNSLGADPEEKIPLPDFMKMKKSQAERWIKENKAENLSLIEEYSDTIEKGQPLRSEIANAEVTPENYRRKDAAKVYYSKGPQTYQKDIKVPDFQRKPRSEVETWAKNNEIDLTYEEKTSNEIPADNIIDQSIAKDEKIAKKDKMSVTVSLGKGYVVPNFSEYSLEDASTALEGVQVQAKGVYTDNLPYGQLVSQSVEAGRVLSAKDDLTIKVLYSLGQPYMKDLRGTMVEGGLQKYFHDEFQSKGANINYVIRHVDSDQPKGTVVGMSHFSDYVPLNLTVSIDISLGNLGSAPTSFPNNNNGGDNGENQETPSE
ncbi:PASTA domain-containing protein [Enterococcus hulanensis]|uniref:PASTA domain-containing protein n=1 Tax=Enterococcus hulanensis TaxID=2559929 RepID=A0ABU3ETY3_9ENTE|nr:PASTA domain-containing protein [Enterococcus hulanensis]MDT2598315.1 PASTA domain-containing protein [Enterococcus hulanensis]MDT2608180.1 PASTA domain-containing protein [Enterococcus hulanensis]MDT2615475.1 PASTA domain-containing protein [Enterococcus hulanensis]MDT2626554.1 PASTA domain-containing protein [Enterococcus hulanensis]MDT2654547.1 PASTA domain-containing protein [Enterococcus hulanensis]